MTESEYKSLCEEENRLFENWKNAHQGEENWHNTTVWEDVNIRDKIYSGIEKTSFVEDGIVSEAYDHKVLFVLKESNLLTHKGNENYPPSQRSQLGWYREFAKTGNGDNRPKQIEKIGRMYCALFDANLKPSKSEICDAVNHIAFMNLNKRGGTNKERIVREYTIAYKKFINKQIEILQPEYIVCLGVFPLLKEVDPNIEKKYKVIDMWHTAHLRDRKKGYISVDKYIDEFINRCKL